MKELREKKFQENTYGVGKYRPVYWGIELLRDKVPSFTEYPFCLPAIRNLYNLKLHPNVTFIVGENGWIHSLLLLPILPSLLHILIL